MAETDEKEMSNPAIQLDKLIRQFDKFLGEAGVVQVSQSIAAAKKGNYTSVLEYLASTLEQMSIAKLQQKYQQVLELVAEIVANVEEESYFSHLKFPPLPKVGYNITENLKEFIQYVAFVRESIQPLIDDEVGSNRRNHFLSAIDKKKKILDKGFFL